MSLQGLATYPGVNQVIACRYTRGLGTQPDHAILEMIPQQNSIAIRGEIRFTFGANFVRLPNCRVDFGSIRASTRSGFTTTVKILDRRWAWQAGGRISGRYNVRFVDGSIDPNTEKTPQELATLLLNEMNESGFNVSDLPNDARPYVEWDYAHPATELDRLVELYGCRVALPINTDRVKIVRLGVGTPPPTGQDVFVLNNGTDVSERPDSLMVVGAPILFQSKLLLEAVGLDNTGEIKKIDDLSYKPANGWGAEGDDFANVTTDENKQLAIRTVWRWYRVKSQADGTHDVPAYKDVLNVDNILPINDFLIETFTNNNNLDLPQPAYVQGLFFDSRTQVQANTSTIDDRYLNDFTINRDKGIVQFNEPIYRDNIREKAEAELYLTCSYNAIDPNSGLPVRYVRELNLGGNNKTGPAVIRRDDILFTNYAEYLEGEKFVDNVVDNLQDVDTEASHQLTASALEYLDDVQYDIGYNGIVPIDVDGLVRQVTFKVDSQDNSPRGGAETYVSVNSETDPYVPRYRTRKRRRESRRERTGIARRQRFRT